jgi:zinc protease
MAATPEISFESYKLDNGLQVLLHVDQGAPIVHTEVWYKVGSKDEVAGKTGFAHLFEHMMFQGTKHIPEDAFFKYLGQAGASARNGSTGTDRTNYYETLPASQAELGLWLESSRMGFLLDRPSVAETFTNQRDVVKNERRQRVDNVPMGALSAIQLGALYPTGHPYQHEIIGSMADLDKATIPDLQDFYGRHYAPSNAVLLVAGDIDPPVIKGLIAKYFAPLGTSVPPAKMPLPAIAPRTKEVRIAMEAKVNLAHERMAWNTVPVFQPGDGELDMVAQILGGGTSSRLYQRLVNDLKLVHSVSAHHMSRQLGGTFEIAFSPLPGKTLAEIEKIVDEELMRIRTEPVSAEEIERARNQIKTDLISGLESVAGIASRLLYYTVFADETGYLGKDLARYDLATPESLRDLANKLLATNQRVVITVDPNAQAPIMGKVKKGPADPDTTPSLKPAPLGKPRVSPDADFRARLPEPLPPKAFQVPPAKRFKLKNGLPVILVESAKLPLVNMSLLIKTGNATNRKGKSGLASLVAEMLDEGTATRSAKQIASEAARLGASLTKYTTWDATSVGVSALKENIPAAIDLWADVVLHPAFADDEVARVKDTILATLSRRKDSPPAVATQVFSRCLWGDNHPFAYPDLGVPADVQNATSADLRAFHQAYFVPNHAVLMVAGDMDEKTLRAKLDPLFAGWKTKKVPPVKVAKVDAPANLRIVLVDKPGAPQSSLRIGLPGIERKNPDYHRAIVTNQILGGGFKRLVMNLRENKGWTYGVGSQFDMRKAPGPWLVSGEFIAAHTVESVEEVIKEITQLRDQEVGAKELADVKAEINGAFPARFATASQAAGQFAVLALHDLPASDLDVFTKKIAAVTPAEIQTTARKYLRPDNLLVVVVGDRKSLAAPLGKLGTVEIRDLDGNPVAPTP